MSVYKGFREFCFFRSNYLHLAPKASALPIAPHLDIKFIVRVLTGLGLAAARAPHGSDCRRQSFTTARPLRLRLHYLQHLAPKASALTVATKPAPSFAGSLAAGKLLPLRIPRFTRHWRRSEMSQLRHTSICNYVIIPNYIGFVNKFEKYNLEYNRL